MQGTRFFNHVNTLLWEREDLGPFQVARILMETADEQFVAGSFRYHLTAGDGWKEGDDDFNIELDVYEADHENTPRAVAEALEARFGISVDRDGSTITVHSTELQHD